MSVLGLGIPRVSWQPVASVVWGPAILVTELFRQVVGEEIDVELCLDPTRVVVLEARITELENALEDYDKKLDKAFKEGDRAISHEQLTENVATGFKALNTQNEALLTRIQELISRLDQLEYTNGQTYLAYTQELNGLHKLTSWCTLAFVVLAVAALYQCFMQGRRRA